MKKFLCMLFLLCWCIPASSQAEEFLNTNERFYLAKTVKLGREGRSTTTISSSLNTGRSSGEIAKECNEGCSTCDFSSGTCSKCSSDRWLKNNACPSCPGNATCNGLSFTCNSGYYKNGESCKSCSNVSISNGTCSKCSNGSTCTTASCNSGYYNSNGSCKSCSNVTVANGTCTACSNSTTCTAMTCNSGYVYRERRAGVWEAGCYPKGTCPTVRPDLSGATCMNVGNNTWQCKTDSVSTSDECSPCSAGYYPKNGGACVSCSNVSMSNGTCSTCTTKGVCTSASCSSGYFNKNGTCKKCSEISVANGKCTSCTNDGTCTAMNCNVAYEYRTKRAGAWEAGCYPVGNCGQVLPGVSGATCMDVGGGTYQCKTDSYFSSKECSPCDIYDYHTNHPGNWPPFIEKVGFSKPKCSTKGVDNSWTVKNLGSVGGKTCYGCVCDGPVLVDGTCCKKGYSTYGGYIECDAGR